MTRHLFEITWKWSNAKKLVGSQFTIILVVRSPPGGHPTKFYTGRPRPKFPPQEPFINCSFERKDTSFIYLLSSNGLPFTDIPTILESNGTANPHPLWIKDEAAQAKTRHFPILDFGGKAGINFSSMLSQDCRLIESCIPINITAVTAPYFTL